jgi:hypothetical protein
MTLNLNCKHHYVYKSPNGEISIGTCIYCGYKNKSLNFIPDEKLRNYPLVTINKYSPMNNIDLILETDRHGKSSYKRDISYLSYGEMYECQDIN